MVSYDEFTRRVAHNTAVFKNALETDTHLVDVCSQLYTMTSEPGGLTFSILIRNLHDIIPSVFLGALASVNNNGVDAYIIHADGTVECLEIKTAEINSASVWRGPKGGLYLGKGTAITQKCALTSYINASYNCQTVENMHSKNMRTILLFSDTSGKYAPNTFIDAWEMKGDTIVDYLARSDCKQRTIKLGSFMKNGNRCDTVFPLMGTEQFIQQVSANAPTRDEWLCEYAA